jgi:hypothetical protein
LKKPDRRKSKIYTAQVGLFVPIGLRERYVKRGIEFHDRKFNVGAFYQPLTSANCIIRSKTDDVT